MRAGPTAEIFGDLTIETTGPAVSYLPSVFGRVDITARDTTRLESRAGKAGNSIRMLDGPATFALDTDAGEFTVEYSIEQDAAAGALTARDADGDPAPVRPVLRYAIDAPNFPLAGFVSDVALSLDLPSLTPTERAALRDAYDHDALTLALLAPDGHYDLLPLAAAPADGFAAITLLDSAGLPTTEFAAAITLRAETSTRRLASISLVVVPEPALIPLLLLSLLPRRRRRRFRLTKP